MRTTACRNLQRILAIVRWEKQDEAWAYGRQRLARKHSQYGLSFLKKKKNDAGYQAWAQKSMLTRN